MVRVGPPENDTSVRSLRDTISKPLNGATVTLIGSDEWLTARSGVHELLTHRDPVLIDRDVELGLGAACSSASSRTAITSP